MNRQYFDPDMNLVDLVDLVAFKWLMAGRGWWVDLPRLARDTEYAKLCVERGAENGLASLIQSIPDLQPRMARA